MFPCVDDADEDGLLALGGNLDSRTLRAAYERGIFPWPHGDGYPTFWFAPPQRAVLFFNELHVSKRLRRSLKSRGYEYSHNRAFSQVIAACAAPRASESGTWINTEMQRAYEKLHREGFAHSIETWREGELVGGLYGVSHGAYFCGESMFSRESDASKGALLFLIETLRNRGASWIDIQMMTPHFEAFGARLISRDEFTTKLSAAWNSPVFCLESRKTE
jgi:leucyl/phenylalanyl-tRNA--protein transferase